MNKRLIALSVELVVIGMLLGASIVQALTPAAGLTISSGVYPGAPSYTVWKEGSNYYAKNEYGEIENSGTNASSILQTIFDSLTLGGSVAINNLLTLTHEVSMSTTDGITLYGLNMNTTGFVASDTFTGSALLKIESGSNHVIRDLRFYGSAINNSLSPPRAQNVSGAFYGIWVDGFDVKNIHIERIHATYFRKYSVYLNGNEVSWILDSIICESYESCLVLQDATNFHLKGLEVGGSLTGNGYHFSYAREGQITDCSSYWNGDDTHYGYTAGNGFYVTYKTRGLVFTNCESEDNWYDGFFVGGSGVSAEMPGNLTFVDCRGIRNGQHPGSERTHGMFIANASYVLLSSSLFYDDCLTTGWPSATAIQDGGIGVSGSLSNFIIISNCLTFGNTGARTPNIGIEIDEDASNLYVTNSYNHTAWIASYNT